MKNPFRRWRLWNLFLTGRFFLIGVVVILLFFASYFIAILEAPAALLLLLFIVLTLGETIILFIKKDVVELTRNLAEKLSNGDDNQVEIVFTSLYPFPVYYEIIDEVPHQFQMRNFSLTGRVSPGETVTKHYTLKPVERGEYSFGNCLIFSSSVIGLVRRKHTLPLAKKVPVYPSIIQMRQYDIFAVSNRLTEVGAKKIRTPGVSMEFDQIRNYIQGDDIRKINWRATARRNDLMVNQFRDERAQHIYSVIDMGRVMKMSFEKMTLLDYAVNSSLVFSNIALRKDDKAGLITFSKTIDSVVPADRRHTQVFTILETLYNLSSDFVESSYEDLTAMVMVKLTQRSLLLLYTNFETVESMKRHLKYLRMMAKRHLVVVIFFENTEIEKLLHKKAKNIKEIYIHTIAEKFAYEKRQIVKELEQNGLHAILTSPKSLTIDTINKYIELKSRGNI